MYKSRPHFAYFRSVSNKNTILATHKWEKIHPVLGFELKSSWTLVSYLNLWTRALQDSPPNSWCYKTLFGANLDFPKIKKLNKGCSNVWTCSKMSKQCYFKQNNALELFISLKMAISCCFGLRGNLDFPDFLQIKFYNINYRSNFWRKETRNN